MFWNKTPSKEELEKELESLNQSIELLKKRFEGSAMDPTNFAQQSEKLIAKKEKILQQLDKYN